MKRDTGTNSYSIPDLFLSPKLHSLHFLDTNTFERWFTNAMISPTQFDCKIFKNTTMNEQVFRSYLSPYWKPWHLCYKSLFSYFSPSLSLPLLDWNFILVLSIKRVIEKKIHVSLSSEFTTFGHWHFSYTNHSCSKTLITKWSDGWHGRREGVSLLLCRSGW